ncbi:MAG: CRISPR-associated endonuclease Cas1 [Desulfitobacteriia bacterium]
MSFLYVSESNCRLYIDSGRIVAEKKDGTKSILPLEILEGVVLLSNADVTTPCVKELLERGIPLTYLSKSGAFYGRLESTKHINIERQREQFRKGDDKRFCLGFAKRIITAKINNQCVILRRYNRYKDQKKVEGIIHELSKYLAGIERAKKIDEILGYEGASAKKYFEALALLVKKEFAFKGRNRMPPRDPFNSLLSLGYTLLMYEIYTAVVNKGLHPYAGFLHQDKHGHPALVSDLMEEWRPVIVDSLVTSILNSGTLKPADFTVSQENNAVLLEKGTLKLYLKEFEKKIRTEAKYLTYINNSVSFRRAIQHQASHMAKAIEENDSSLYHPVRIR